MQPSTARELFENIQGVPKTTHFTRIRNKEYIHAFISFLKSKNVFDVYIQAFKYYNEILCNLGMLPIDVLSFLNQTQPDRFLTIMELFPQNTINTILDLKREWFKTYEPIEYSHRMLINLINP